MIGVDLALARYATPKSWMKATGDVEALDVASGLSFPRGERARPITSIAGLKLFSASYEVASIDSYVAAATLAPDESNCGRQKRGWFGSFPTMKSCTDGKAFASCTQNAAKCALPWVAVTPSGRSGETMRTICTPAAFAALIARFSAAYSV